MIVFIILCVYILSTYFLITLEVLCVSIAFIQFSFPLVTTNIIYFFIYFFWNKIDPYNPLVLVTHHSDNISIHFKMITRMSSSPLSTAKMLQLWLYFPWIFHTCDSFILKTGSLYLHLSHLFLSFPLPANCLLCVFNSVSVHLFLYFMYRVKSYIFVFFVRHISFSTIPIVHSCHKWQTESFFWLSNIPLYVYVTSFSIRLLMSTYIASMSWLL